MSQDKVCHTLTVEILLKPVKKTCFQQTCTARVSDYQAFCQLSRRDLHSSVRKWCTMLHYAEGKISVKWVVLQFLPLLFGSKSGKWLHSVLSLVSVRNKASAPQNPPPPHSTHHSAPPPLPVNNEWGNRSTDGLIQRTRWQPLQITYSIS